MQTDNAPPSVRPGSWAAKGGAGDGRRSQSGRSPQISPVPALADLPPLVRELPTDAGRTGKGPDTHVSGLLVTQLVVANHEVNARPVRVPPRTPAHRSQPVRRRTPASRRVPPRPHSYQGAAPDFRPSRTSPDDFSARGAGPARSACALRRPLLVAVSPASWTASRCQRDQVQRFPPSLTNYCIGFAAALWIPRLALRAHRCRVSGGRDSKAPPYCPVP